MTIIDTAYLQRVMAAEDYARAFDRDGTGTADAVAIASAIALAESTALAILNGGHAVTVPLDGTVDEVVKIQIARMAMYEAVRFSVSDGMNGAKSPYRQGYEDAVKFLNDWRKDAIRPPSVNSGEQTYPRAGARNLTNTDGNSGGAYDRAASGRDNTGF